MNKINKINVRLKKNNTTYLHTDIVLLQKYEYYLEMQSALILWQKSKANNEKIKLKIESLLGEILFKSFSLC